MTMSFNFAARADSSDEEAAVDLSAWQSGANRKRVTPPRRSSGFQAVNQPSEDVAMEMEPEPEPEPEPALVPGSAPVAQMQASAEAADAMLISSDKESSDDEEEEEEAVPVVAKMHNVSAGAEEDAEDEDAIEVQPQVGDGEPEEDELVVPTSKITVSVPHHELEEEDFADFEDFTTGGDAVSSVLQEQQDEDGVMTYLVEFEDQHVEQVSRRHVMAYSACADA